MFKYISVILVFSFFTFGCYHVNTEKYIVDIETKSLVTGTIVTKEHGTALVIAGSSTVIEYEAINNIKVSITKQIDDGNELTVTVKKITKSGFAGIASEPEKEETIYFEQTVASGGIQSGVIDL